MTQPAFFLDRDGVINFDHGYVSEPSAFDFIPGVFDACKTIINNGYAIIIVTNQAGIGRGFYDETAFLSLSQWMVEVFEEHGIHITDVRYCPHHSEHGIGAYLKACDFRKPNPGMILAAAQQHDITLADSVMVGDKTSDMEAGKRAGISHLYKVAEEQDKTERLTDWVACHRLIDAVNHYFNE